MSLAKLMMLVQITQFQQRDNYRFIVQEEAEEMLTAVEEIPQEPTPSNPPIQATYQKVEAQLQVHQYFSVLLKQEPLKIHSQKLITPKMRTKLYGWLEKLALETFKFSKYTLLTAALIIDQYLEKTNQPPAVLQLIGCTGLFLASKLREEIIVDPECYSTASCNVFSKRQLLERERAMYEHLDWKRLKNGVIMGVRIGCTLLGMKDHLDRCEEILWSCLKDEELMDWREVRVVYGVLSLASIDPQGELGMRDCLNLIKLI